MSDNDFKPSDAIGIEGLKEEDLIETNRATQHSATSEKMTDALESYAGEENLMSKAFATPDSLTDRGISVINEAAPSVDYVENSPKINNGATGVGIIDETAPPIEYAGNDVHYRTMGNVFDDMNFDPKEIMQKAEIIIKQLPEMLQSTTSIGIIANIVPDEGIDIIDIARQRINEVQTLPDIAMDAKATEAINKFNSMPDEEVLSKVQETLETMGLSDLAENIKDGNLSKMDLIEGFSEYGHVANSRNPIGEIDSEITAQLQKSIGTEISGDENLLKGLILAEQQLDNTINEMIENEVSKMQKLGLSDDFSDKAFNSGTATDAVEIETPKSPIRDAAIIHGM